MRRAVYAAVALLLFAAALADVRVQLHLKRVVPDHDIEAEFVARSTPGSAKYQQHLSHEELTELVQGRPAAVSGVEKYFAGKAGVSHQKLFSTRDVYSAVITREAPLARRLGLAPAMFERSAVRNALKVPRELEAYVERITVVSPKLRQRPRRYKSDPRGAAAEAAGGSLPFPGSEQTPQSIKDRYKIPAAEVPKTFVQGVGEFQDSYFNPAWISTFSTNYSLPQPDIRVAGPNSPSSDDLEGTLDLEYISGLAPGAVTWWISSNDTSTDPYGIDFAWWSDQVLTLAPMPTVVSLSWGIGENAYYGRESVLIADNDGFRKLGLRGISVLAASGDDGPGSRGFISCSLFDPGWPAASPYVLSVGATYSNGAGQPEIGVSFSGGGFSDYFPRPSWQESAVASFLAKSPSLPNRTLFNASGRAFPDVSALGTNFMVYGDTGFGQAGWQPIAGTSCASPTFAAVLTRVNAARAAIGKPSLGFVNPTLYLLGKVGYDVTSGTNLDPDCFGIFTIKGFTAMAGWDPVTGLGTPDYEFLAEKLAPNATTVAPTKQA